jgi:ethanolamine utilization cobalamin adenosyltransferase
MKDDGRKVVGNKVNAEVTNVSHYQWCKSHYVLSYKTKKSLALLKRLNMYMRQSDIGPAQCYNTASFDSGYNDIKSNKIHLSQRKVFVENEQPKYPPNASITTHAGAVVDVKIDASY